ncbi:pentapeptide repeat-containing protein [Streptomyces avermitilis]|uniref:pentapeptide repeat-containing protein n=1 Tax=Streptomyces avermitilis TaxID=33903 RepID=UPI0033FA5A3D
MKQKLKRIALAALLTLVSIGYVLLLWRGPWWIDGTHLRAKNLQPADGVVITGFRTMLVAVGAGAVAAFGLYYTHKGHKQTEALFQHTQDKDREQAELTREGQVTDRYVEAIKLLGSENVTQRLGGVFALERIMRDSEKDHALVVQVLAGFIRQHASQPLPGLVEVSARFQRGPLGEEIQAALTVLGRRPVRKESFEIDLRSVHLVNAHLYKANFAAFDLRETDLSGAYLLEANLAGAELEGAQLSDAYLVGAQMNEALMARADLSGADLSQANLSRAQMYGVTLTRAVMQRADLSSADLSRADMTGASLHGAKLTNAFFVETKLDRAHLGETQDCTIQMLLGADLRSTTTFPARLADAPELEERIQFCETEAAKKPRNGIRQHGP